MDEAGTLPTSDAGHQRTAATPRNRWAAAAVGCVACTVSAASVLTIALGSSAAAIGAGLTYLVPLLLGLAFGAWILRGRR